MYFYKNFIKCISYTSGYPLSIELGFINNFIKAMIYKRRFEHLIEYLEKWYKIGSKHYHFLYRTLQPELFLYQRVSVFSLHELSFQI